MQNCEEIGKSCAVCQGKLERVVLAVTGAATDWHVSKADRNVTDMLSGQYRTEAHAYTCTSCGRITFYAANLEELLQAQSQL